MYIVACSTQHTAHGTRQFEVCVKGKRLQFVDVWKRWPQTLHSRLPKPDFFSILTLTDFSWLQKRQLKTVGRGSF